MIRVKICGITRKEDADIAVELGADALGFNFAEGPRLITPSVAASIVRSLPPFVVPVAVFADELPEKLIEVSRDSGIWTVQLHGEEPPDYLKRLVGFKVIKAFRVRTKEDVQAVSLYPCDAALFDTRTEGKRGGTGKTFDWDLLKFVPEGIPVILSGGLTPDNVIDAIRRVRPYAVDVASGVESSPGVKDRELLHRFIENARSA